jgi:hypothetical protein
MLSVEFLKIKYKYLQNNGLYLNIVLQILWAVY